MYFSPSCKSIWDISLASNCYQRNQIFISKNISSPLRLRGGFRESANDSTSSNGASQDSQEGGIGLGFVNVFIFTPLYQPLKVTRFLIQHGYEPVSPYSVTGRGVIDYLMNRPASVCRYLPGIIGYSRGMAHKFGWKSLFAGLGPSLCQMMIDTTFDIRWSQPVDKFLIELINYTNTDVRSRSFNMKRVLLLSMKASIIQSCSMFYSYPFYVVGSICILRCIQGEPSVWMWSVFRQVWQEAGIGGFYSGILALWLYQVINVWCEEFLVELYRTLMLHITDEVGDKDGTGDYTASHLLITSFTYPLSLVSSIMTSNTSSVKCNLDIPRRPQFTSCLECFRHLYKNDIWFRGSTLLQRRNIS